MKTTCSRCDEPLGDRLGRGRYCRKCNNEASARSRKPYAELSEERRRRQIARSYANVCLKRGKISRSPCIKCGTSENLHMHHHDYSKPLEIEWMCRPCHEATHFPGVKKSHRTIRHS